MKPTPLPFRQIHLDFHTSEHIPGVGALFDPDEFVQTLKRASVNSVTLFGKCHHGWSYYPTRIGTPHPSLVVPDLLGEMIAACRKENIQTPVYIPVQWDELTAREHPQWRVMKAGQTSYQMDLGGSGGESELNQLAPLWHPLSVIHEELVDRVIQQALEVIERYDPEGLFMDILLPWQDVSPRNIARMQERGLDPEKEADRLQNDREVILAYYERFWESVHTASPATRIFHNSGHAYKGERERWKSFTHLELESLPTGGWGYDHFPMSARYCSQLGKEFLGMTGKFHTTWGEFGGYKTAVALEYECAQMAALGARCSIGDQLHPCGRLDPDTYARIAPAYQRISRLEPWLTEAHPVSNIGILSAEGHRRERTLEKVDMGAGRMLLESQQMFELLDWETDFGDYALLILPDTLRLDPEQAERIGKYLEQGGSILATGESLLQEQADSFAINVGAGCGGMRRFSPDYIVAGDQLAGPHGMVRSPFVTYSRGVSVIPQEAEVLAGVHDPYFNRSWKHFCSHQHTPYRPESNDREAAAIRMGRVIYFAHPLFGEYYRSGQPLTKALVLNALRLLLPHQPLQTNLPSSARVSWMRQKKENRDILHLLFAQTQLRGSSVAGWSGSQSIEIIEDTVPLHDVELAILPGRPVKRIYSPYNPDESLSGEIDEGGYLCLRVPRLYLHEAIVLEY